MTIFWRCCFIQTRNTRHQVLDVMLWTVEEHDRTITKSHQKWLEKTIMRLISSDYYSRSPYWKGLCGIRDQIRRRVCLSEVLNEIRRKDWSADREDWSSLCSEKYEWIGAGTEWRCFIPAMDCPYADDRQGRIPKGTRRIGWIMQSWQTFKKIVSH